MIVRPEHPDDFGSVAALVEEAFGDPRIAQLVADIRASPGYRPELSLVAEDRDEILGHVMLSDLDVGDGRGLQLSPLAVLPARQRKGIGSALVNAALTAAAALEEPLVLVEGAPAYYSRFGFRRSTELGIERPNERVPEWAFQAVALGGEHPVGRAVYPPPFDAVA